LIAFAVANYFFFNVNMGISANQIFYFAIICYIAYVNIIYEINKSTIQNEINLHESTKRSLNRDLINYGFGSSRIDYEKEYLIAEIEFYEKQDDVKIKEKYKKYEDLHLTNVMYKVIKIMETKDGN
jgi:hypothetical protein